METPQDEHISLREAAVRYVVSYGTLIRRVNSDRAFTTQARTETGEWRVAVSELAELYTQRELAKVETAEAESAELRAEVARLEAALRDQEEALRNQQTDAAERLQAARNEVAAERARADKTQDRVEFLNGEVQRKLSDQRAAEQARDRALALSAQMMDQFPERGELRRRARPAYEAKRERLRALRDQTLALGPGSATDEAVDPS